MSCLERIGPKVILALGGGAARGVSHVGVVRTLVEAGFEIQGVAGTSIGSIIGGAYAAGRLDEAEAFLRGLGWAGMLRMLDPVLPRSGFFGGRRLVETLTELLGDVRVEELGLPFVAVAADVNTGEEVRLARGRLAHALRASSGIPGFFDPYREALIEAEDGRERWLVDGIVAGPVPVGAARSLGDWPIIAVDVNVPFPVAAIGGKSGVDEDRVAPSEERAEAGTSPDEEVEGDEPERETSRLRAWLEALVPSSRSSAPNGRKRPSIIESIYSSSMMLQHNFTLAQYREHSPALVIEPNMSGVNMFDFHMAEELIAEGVRSTELALHDAGE